MTATVTRDATALTSDYDVVLVSYHSHDQLVGLLAATRPDQRIVIVDNASGADGTQQLTDGLPERQWLDGGNVGFARAANLGARASTADFLVFANPDTRPSPEIWDALVGELKADPSLGSCAAATVNAAGRIEVGVGGWQPTPVRAFVYAFGLHKLFRNRGVFAQPTIGRPVEMGWITGACLAVRRQSFLALGGFDERYYVYNEDMALGGAMEAAGLRQLLRADLTVPHATSSSGGGGTTMPQQRGASMAAYLRDHNAPLTALVMRTTFATGMAARLMAAVIRGRSDVARQHAAYIKGIVTGRSPFAGAR